MSKTKNYTFTTSSSQFELLKIQFLFHCSRLPEINTWWKESHFRIRHVDIELDWIVSDPMVIEGLHKCSVPVIGVEVNVVRTYWLIRVLVFTACAYLLLHSICVAVVLTGKPGR